MSHRRNFIEGWNLFATAQIIFPLFSFVYRLSSKPNSWSNITRCV